MCALSQFSFLLNEGLEALHAEGMERLRIHSFSCVGNAPDGVRTVIGNQQRPVDGRCHANGTAPDISVGKDEAGEEILVATVGVAGVMQRHANDFIAGANRPVPGAVLGGEDVAAIFLAETACLHKRSSRARRCAAAAARRER